MLEESFLGHVLVVDDDRSVLSILGSILGRDYAVSTVTSGVEAIEILETRLVDLVLLDIMMPDMDGIEVCAAIKANPKIADLPIIFLTGMEDEGAEEAALEAGAVDFISKPVRPRVVESRVRLQMQNHLYLQFLESVLTEKDTTIESLRTEVSTLLDSTSSARTR
jgi:putative two-component system response regulator